MSGALLGGAAQDAVIYTIEEALERARISRGLFYKLLRQGQGPRLIRMGRRTFVTPKELVSWIDRLQRGSNPPKPHQVTGEVATAA